MVNTSREKLTERLVELVERINQSMHCQPPEGWSDLELTISQIRVLVFLYQEPQRMGNIAGFLGSILSSATSLIDRLVEKGLVERMPDPSDRRVVVCALTPQGQEAIEQFWRIGRVRITELAEQLDPAELKDVVHAMELLHRAAQAVGPQG
jgi:DNA-binding MarR family transcriptional regulator